MGSMAPPSVCCPPAQQRRGFKLTSKPRHMCTQALSQSQPAFIAWRTAYLIVGWMQILISIAVRGRPLLPALPRPCLPAFEGRAVATPEVSHPPIINNPTTRPHAVHGPNKRLLQVLVWGQDLPGGNYAALRRRGSMRASTPARDYLAAARNYRTWVLMIVYGFSFGVELTMNNGEAGQAGGDRAVLDRLASYQPRPLTGPLLNTPPRLTCHPSLPPPAQCSRNSFTTHSAPA